VQETSLLAPLSDKVASSIANALLLEMMPLNSLPKKTEQTPQQLSRMAMKTF
jgi:hypothetical protein